MEDISIHWHCKQVNHTDKSMQLKLTVFKCMNVMSPTLLLLNGLGQEDAMLQVLINLSIESVIQKFLRTELMTFSDGNVTCIC